MFRKKKAERKLSVIWENASWEDAIDFRQIRNWKAPARNRRLQEGNRVGYGPKTGRGTIPGEGGRREQRRLEEGDRGGHGPKTGRSTI